MRLQLDGREISLHCPNQLMAHLGNLRSQPTAALRIELDDASAICLDKDGDRAVVRYQTASNSVGFLASEGEASIYQMLYKRRLLKLFPSVVLDEWAILEGLFETRGLLQMEVQLMKFVG